MKKILIIEDNQQTLTHRKRQILRLPLNLTPLL